MLKIKFLDNLRGDKEEKNKKHFQMTIYIWITLILLINTFVIFCLAFAIFYSGMKDKYELNVKNSISTNLTNVVQELNNSYEIMADMSLMLATDTEFLEKLDSLYLLQMDSKHQGTEELIKYTGLRNDLQKQLDKLISFNRVVGRISYYQTQQDNYLGELGLAHKISDGLEQGIIRTLYASGTIKVNAIHESVVEKNKNVISIIREINSDQVEGVNLYIESNADYVRNTFRNNRFSEDLIFAVTNMEGIVVFSENDSVISSGSVLKEGDAEKYYESKGYYLTRKQGIGYYIVGCIPSNCFHMNMLKWNWQMSVSMLIIVLLVVLITLFMWRMICKPLNIFGQEFQLLANYRQTNYKYTGISEFDNILEKFYKARENVDRLNQEILIKEQKQKELEIEKIMMQINPHFIHNTLNCIQWLARIDGNKDIEEIVTLFTRVLNYNLGKGDARVTVSDECAAMRNYIELQKIKNHVPLKMVMDIPTPLMDCLIPRFVLQPLIENSIKYARPADGNIIIRIAAEYLSKEWMLLSVWDNGTQMDENVIEDLRKEDIETSKLGIGLKFVRHMLETYCDEGTEIYAESSQENGSKVTMKLKIYYQEVSYDTGIDC